MIISEPPQGRDELAKKVQQHQEKPQDQRQTLSVGHKIGYPASEPRERYGKIVVFHSCSLRLIPFRVVLGPWIGNSDDTPPPAAREGALQREHHRGRGGSVRRCRVGEKLPVGRQRHMEA
jgi:hypothetical protein